MSSTPTLLKNGVALIHDSSNHVVPTKTDILLRDGRIEKIGEGIDVSGIEGIQVVDCTDKIISPGFIDTHHHGWQTQLKGRHADETLLEYMVTGNIQSFQFTPRDIFFGQLAGMQESLAAGTTTIVDHAHMNYSAEHSKMAIAGTASSGIRSVFCYAPIMRATQFNPFTLNPNILEDWVMQTFAELADAAPFGDGRVTLGFAFDHFFLPGEVLKSVFDTVVEKGTKTITAHSASVMNPVDALKSLGVLDERVIISHGGYLKQENATVIKGAGAHLSATPSTELQMAMGRPYCFDAAFKDGGYSGEQVGFQGVGSLGVDCHTNNAGSIILEARLGLQNARNHFNEHYLKLGKIPRALPDSLTVEAAFNLATVQGATAANMGKDIGRIAEGCRADLVVFDALSPGMVGAAQHDPVAAVIMHSSPGDIETVFVDGIVRKKDGKLLPIAVDDGAEKVVGTKKLEWRDIAQEIVKSRAEIQAKIEKADLEEAKATLMKLFQFDETIFAD